MVDKYTVFATIEAVLRETTERLTLEKLFAEVIERLGKDFVVRLSD